MGKQKKTRKFAVAKKIISAKDSRMWVEGVRLGLIILQWAFLFPCKLFPCYESLNELFNFIWCDAPYFHFHPYSKENQNKSLEIVKKENKAKEEAPKHIVQVPTALFFQYNTQLGPPYHVLVDTNFINFSNSAITQSVMQGMHFASKQSIIDL